MEEEEFRTRFVVEAKEIVQELEEALLKLEKSPGDASETNNIFRHMHSLKGSGAMFGFLELSNFTHHLENLFDIVRKNPASINKKIFDVTFRSVDHIKNLLANSRGSNVTRKGMKLTADVKAIIESMVAADSVDSDIVTVEIAPVTKQATPKASESNQATYYIYFKPDESILVNGSNPLYLIDELMGLGRGYVMTHTSSIPGINQIKPLLCYTFWEIILATSEPVNELKDIFLFVEHSSEIEITKISDEDLFVNPSLGPHLKTLVRQSQEIDLEFIKTFSKNTPSVDSSVASPDPEISAEEETEAEAEIQPAVHELSRANTTIRVDSEKLDVLMNLVSEFVTAQARLDLYAQQKGDPNLSNISELFHKLSRQLRENTFDICLIPIHTLVTKFSRLVRDLSRETGKAVELIAKGTDTELDKTIIEQLSEPLLHIIRNCVDHGIESKEERLKKGKPETGQILFHSYYSGAFVYIIIQDDGKGIDPKVVKQKAIQKGIKGIDDYTGKKELFQLLFHPGFTTSEKVTKISGRGVGMDVVKQKIEELRGEVEIESEKDSGTSIVIKIPLTLSIIDGFLVKVGDSAYILPLASVEKIYALEPGKADGTYQNVVTLDGQQYPFFDLRREFNVPVNAHETAYIINVRYEDKIIGLAIEKIIGKYQAVLKPIGKYLKNQDMFSGATILGDGSVALVLDTNRIITKYANQ